MTTQTAKKQLSPEAARIAAIVDPAAREAARMAKHIVPTPRS